MIFQVVVKRVLQLIPIILGVTFFSYVLLALLPGDAALAIAGLNPSIKSVQAVRIELGLNHSIWQRYGHWLWQALHGNFGRSVITGQPILHIINQRLPVTIELVVMALIIAIAISIPVATIAAFKAGGPVDKVLSVISMFGLCVPGFVVGLLLIFIFAVHLQLLPAVGFTPLTQSLTGNLKTMILPALTISFALFATYTRILRNDIAEQLATEDYVVTARAKGISARRVLVRHVLRNALMSFVTVVAVNLGGLIGGSVIIESLFSLPGVGQQLINAINDRDATLVQGIVVIIAMAVVVANLLADLLYTAIDPRVRYGRRDV